MSALGLSAFAPLFRDQLDAAKHGQSEARRDWSRKLEAFGPDVEVVCYHGTAFSTDPTVRAAGLVANPVRTTRDRVDNRPEPYVAAHPLRAVCYAIHAVAHRVNAGVSGQGVVYTVRLPARLLSPDSLGRGAVRELVVCDEVPSSWIVDSWVFGVLTMTERLREVIPNLPAWVHKRWYRGWDVLVAFQELERRAADLGALAADVWPSPSSKKVASAESVVSHLLRDLEVRS